MKYLASLLAVTTFGSFPMARSFYYDPITVDDAAENAYFVEQSQNELAITSEPAPPPGETLAPVEVSSAHQVESPDAPEELALAVIDINGAYNAPPKPLSETTPQDVSPMPQKEKYETKKTPFKGLMPDAPIVAKTHNYDIEQIPALFYSEIFPHFQVSEEMFKYILRHTDYKERHDNGDIKWDTSAGYKQPIVRDLNEEEVAFYNKWAFEGDFPDLSVVSKGDLKKHSEVLDQVIARLCHQDPFFLQGPNYKTVHKMARAFGMFPGSFMQEGENFALSLFYTHHHDQEGIFHFNPINISPYWNEVTNPNPRAIIETLTAAFTYADYKTVSFALNIGNGHWVSLVIERGGIVAVVDSFGPSAHGVQKLVANLNRIGVKNREGDKINFKLYQGKGAIGTRMQADGNSCGVHAFLNGYAAAAYGSIQGVHHLTTLIKRGRITTLEEFMDVFVSSENVETIVAERKPETVANANQLCKNVRHSLINRLIGLNGSNS